MLLYAALSILTVNVLAVAVIARLGGRLSSATDEQRRVAVARAKDTAPVRILRAPVSLHSSPQGDVYLGRAEALEAVGLEE
jgi:hypothetical protein